MDEVANTISFGIGRKNSERFDSAVLDKAQDGWNLEATRPLYQKAEAQLGTVGSGNHYVDIFTDEDDRVWIGVHFGSRGFGHGVATWFLKAAGAKDGMDAGAYTYAGRDWVCNRVAKILGAEVLEVVHNHHNFAWHEKHGDEMFWVVRKGATPAVPL
jgi:tRNA-splicing ligase RtcB (3'-phosphate/5'-hydroxy nucleic acid ligase)